jgi:hypothetical protein
MQQQDNRPAFVFTEVPGDISISRSTYENEDGIFFLSVHERPKENNATRYLINIFNMADPMEEDGTVFIMPWAQMLCAFTQEWVNADPDVNLVESAEDAAMGWLDAEDVVIDSTRYLIFTEDEPEGEERDWPLS